MVGLVSEQGDDPGYHVEWPWEAAKELFMKPDVTPADKLELEWKSPDIEGLVDFLVKEKGFKYVPCLHAVPLALMLTL